MICSQYSDGRRHEMVILTRLEREEQVKCALFRLLPPSRCEDSDWHLLLTKVRGRHIMKLFRFLNSTMFLGVELW